MKHRGIAGDNERVRPAHRQRADLPLVRVGHERHHVRVVHRVHAPLRAGPHVRLPVVAEGEREVVEIVVVHHLLGAELGVEPVERALARLRSRRRRRSRRRVREAGIPVRDLGELAVLVGDRVEGAVLCERDVLHFVARKVVDDGGVPWAGDPVEEPLALGSRVDRAVVGDGERDEVRLVAREVDRRLAVEGDAEDLPLVAGRREEGGLGLVPGERPDMAHVGDLREHVDLRRRQLEDLPVGDRAGVDDAVALHERGHRRLFRVGPHRGLAAGDADHFPVEARADEDAAVGLGERRVDRARAGERDVAERQPRADTSVGAHRDPFEVAAGELLEGVEIEEARADRAGRRRERDPRGGERDRAKDDGRAGR